VQRAGSAGGSSTAEFLTPPSFDDGEGNNDNDNNNLAGAVSVEVAAGRGWASSPIHTNKVANDGEGGGFFSMTPPDASTAGGGGWTAPVYRPGDGLEIVCGSSPGLQQ